MKPGRLAAVLLLTIASARAGEPPSFDAVTLDRLEQALARVNLSTADLSWDKRPISDEFRLSCVNETLDTPLALSDRAARAEREFASDPAASARAAAGWLDVEKLETGSGTVSETETGSGTVSDSETGSGTVLDSRSRKYKSKTFSGAEFPDGEDASLFPGAPPEAARLLASLVATYRRANALREQAVSSLSAEEKALLAKSGARLYTEESEEDWDMGPVLAVAAMVNLRALIEAEIVLADEVVRIRTEAAVRIGNERKGLDTTDWPSLTWSVGGLKVVLGGSGPDRHDADVILGGSGPDDHEADVILDVGGDDIYTGGSVVVDLGGDDTYRETGQGFGRIGLVVDLAGNDRYLGSNFVQGGAAFGASLLVDVAGDDRYEADQCSQGAGFFGVGLLFDLAGNDSYRGARFVQGFGGVRGLGALSDAAGNDTYYAGGKYSHAPLLPENFQSLSQGFGFGLRGASASGGVGILADHAGNDIYSAEVFGQGASYWFSLGILVDSAGHDKYDLYQYGQGAGIHLSSGVLFDRAGNDAYSCNNGVAQGSGHDWGVGLLWDLAGDDAYQGSGMSQGGANANGIGMLVDRAGNDSYAGWNVKNQGDSFFARGTIGLGVLLDLGGKDKYTHGGRDGLVWTNGTVGVGSDTEEPPASPSASHPASPSAVIPAKAGIQNLAAPQTPASPQTLAAPQPPASPPAVIPAKAGIQKPTLSTPGSGVRRKDHGKGIPTPAGAAALTPADRTRLDALWGDACLWEVGSNSEKVPAARKSLIAEGEKALGYLIPSKLATKDTLITRALNVVITGIHGDAPARLMPALRSADADVRRNAADLLGALGATEAASAIAELLADPGARLGALSALGALKSPSAAGQIVALMNSDSPERVRYTAAATLGAIGGEEAVAALTGTLSSPVASLRFAAQYALEQAKAVDSLRRLVDHPDLRVRLHAIAALGHIGLPESAPDLRRLLRDESPLVRGFAAEVLGALHAPEDRPLFEQMLAKESDPFARGKLEAAVNATARGAPER